MRQIFLLFVRPENLSEEPKRKTALKNNKFIKLFLHLRMSWSSEENQRFLELLEKYPAEKSQRKRWEKISNELGTKTLQLRCKKLAIQKLCTITPTV